MCRQVNFTSTSTLSCSPKVISASVAIANLLHRARTPWILEHPVIHGCGMYRKARLLWHSLARPGPRRILHFCITVQKNERCFWLEAVTAALQCFKSKTWSSPKCRITRRALLIHPPTHVVFRACHGSHHERTTFLGLFLWSGRSFTQRVKRILLWGLLVLRLFVNHIQ